MIKKIVDAKSTGVNEINSELDTLEDIRVMCDSLSDNTGRESRQELLTKIETLSDIERNSAENFSGVQEFTYHEYQAPDLTAEARCGRISEGTITADLSKGNVPRNVGVKYKVKKRILLDFPTDNWVHVTPLDTTSVLVLGKKKNAQKLARVNIQTGEELVSEVDQKGWVRGMTTVELVGRKVLALSLGTKLEFREVETLQLISTHSVDPHQPCALCVSSPSTLLYEDCSQRPRQVHTLDYSGVEPTHVGVINTELDCIYDMCVVKNGGVELLVCVGSKIMTAHDLRTGEVKWRVEFMGGFTPYSVTSDCPGHVITCDGEQNIRTFHVSEGRYLGEHQMALDALWEQGITEPFEVTWNSDGSSLIVCHAESVDEVQKYFISVVHVNKNLLEV